MALKTFVKVGSITNLSDARYCAGMGVDMLGFCLDATADSYIDPEAYKEIVGWVTGPQFVGEFENESVSGILDAKEALKFDIIQTTNKEAANRLAASMDVILKITPTLIGESTLREYLTDVDDSIKYILVESEDDIENDNHLEIRDLTKEYDILKGYNLNAGSINDELDDFAGISLKGSEEEKPGFKDYDELADILEALEEDD